MDNTQRMSWLFSYVTFQLNSYLQKAWERWAFFQDKCQASSINLFEILYTLPDIM